MLNFGGAFFFGVDVFLVVISMGINWVFVKVGTGIKKW